MWRKWMAFVKVYFIHFNILLNGRDGVKFYIFLADFLLSSVISGWRNGRCRLCKSCSLVVYVPPRSAPLMLEKCSLRTWWWSEAQPCCRASCTGCWPRYASWWRNRSTAVCWRARACEYTLHLPSPTALPGSEVRFKYLSLPSKPKAFQPFSGEDFRRVLFVHIVWKAPPPLSISITPCSTGAIFGALQDILGSRSVSRDYYNQTGRIPDWCCLSSPPPESLYEAGKTPPPLMKRAFSTEK